ncbi:MAG TPA: hypothetical protein VLM75_14720 [Spirochaetota bacterium]|nr:hypothetical protein [Spirochaetota bacterium]
MAKSPALDEIHERYHFMNNAVKASVKAFKLILLPLVVIAIFKNAMSAGVVQGNGFPDTGRIMLLFGFPGGRFDPVMAGDMQLDYEIESKVGLTEGDSSIDTAQEFITAAFLSRVSLSESGRREFEAELPKSGDGALRLCAVWLFRMAEYPARAPAYRTVLNLIRKKTAITDNAIVDHYVDALTRRLDSMEIDGLDPREEEHLRRLVLLYMMDPVNPPPAADLREFMARLKTLSPKKAQTALNFLNELSPVVAARFEEKSGARRG